MRSRPCKLNQTFLDNFNYLDEKGQKNESFIFSLFKDSELTNVICRQAIQLRFAVSAASTFPRFIQAIIDGEVCVYMQRFAMSTDDSVDRLATIRTSKAKGDFEKRLIAALNATESAIRNDAEFTDYQREALLCLVDRIQALPDKISHLVNLDSSSGEIPPSQLRRYSEIYHDFLVTGKAKEGYAEVFTKPLNEKYAYVDLSCGAHGSRPGIK